MYSYVLLEPECYYLIQEKENERLTLLQVKVVSETSMYVIKYNETAEMQWKRKTDPIFDILELLGDEPVKEWTSIYYNSEDAFNYEGDDE